MDALVYILTNYIQSSFPLVYSPPSAVCFLNDSHSGWHEMGPQCTFGMVRFKLHEYGSHSAKCLTLKMHIGVIINILLKLLLCDTYGITLAITVFVSYFLNW